MKDVVSECLWHARFIAPVMGLSAVGALGRDRMRVMPVLGGLAASAVVLWMSAVNAGYSAAVTAAGFIMFMAPGCVTVVVLLASRCGRWWTRASMGLAGGLALYVAFTTWGST